MSQPSRFRMFRGRIDGQDLANVHTLGQHLDVGGLSMQADLSTTTAGLILDTLSLDNSATSHVFVGGRFPNAAWKMWRWDESQTNGEEVSEGSGDDITAKAQDAEGDANQVIMTVDENDGWVVGADRKFSTLIVKVKTAATIEITDEFSYWNGASWTSLAATDILCAKGGKGTVPAQGTDLTLNGGDAPVPGADLWGNTGELLLVFSMPIDWTLTKTSSTTTNTAQGGVDSGYYALRWRNTVNPGDGLVPAVMDAASLGCATRLVVWSLSDITTGESLNIPITSSDELPWLVYEMKGAHKSSASVQVTGFNGKLGEGSKG